jgi:hypothetical protein
MDQQHNGGTGIRGETMGAGRIGDERSMIEFIRRWHRFGGGFARDIFVEFGLAEHEFFGRTLALLQTGTFTGMTEETAESIRKVCRWRLSTATTVRSIARIDTMRVPRRQHISPMLVRC